MALTTSYLTSTKNFEGIMNSILGARAPERFTKQVSQNSVTMIFWINPPVKEDYCHRNSSVLEPIFVIGLVRWVNK